MKNAIFNSLTLMILLGCLLLSSCAKEASDEFDDNQQECSLEPTEVHLAARWGEHYKRREGCAPRGIFCRDFWDCLADDEFSDYALANNQVIGIGSLDISNGEEILSFEFTRNNLDKEVSQQLLLEKTMPIAEHEFDPELVEELYKRAGLKYDGEAVMIEKGNYPVKIINEGDQPLNLSTARIKVCIRKYIDDEGKIRRKLVIEIRCTKC